MSKNPLLQVKDLGQSLWIDYIDRELLNSGGLQKLIDEDGIAGLTSNPSIFQKAISTGKDYDADLRAGLKAGKTPMQVFESLAVSDIRRAADILRPVYDSSKKVDGYVSLEVNPELAADARGTIEEARRLWQTVARPNLMIKVPGTAACVGAVAALIGEGINVNVTLLFSVSRYEQIIDAYLEGLETAAENGLDLGSIASVASFFVSRVDSSIDAMLSERAAAAGHDLEKNNLLKLRGKSAVANARCAYAAFQREFNGARFKVLAGQGARVQRPLWASTSTKDPSLPDTLYVAELVGPDTVNTVPPATLDAFRDHGAARSAAGEGRREARAHLDKLANYGIDLDAVTAELENAGVEAFRAAFRDLLAGIDAKQHALA